MRGKKVIVLFRVTNKKNFNFNSAVPYSKKKKLNSIGFLADKYSRYNWNKDKLKGKNKLRTVIINRDKTEHAEYLTFTKIEKYGYSI